MYGCENCGTHLIHDQDFRMLKNGSRHTQKLFFAVIHKRQTRTKFLASAHPEEKFSPLSETGESKSRNIFALTVSMASCEVSSDGIKCTRRKASNFRMSTAGPYDVQRANAYNFCVFVLIEDIKCRP